MQAPNHRSLGCHNFYSAGLNLCFVHTTFSMCHTKRKMTTLTMMNTTNPTSSPTRQTPPSATSTSSSTLTVGMKAGFYAKQRIDLAHTRSRLVRKAVDEFDESDLHIQERLGEGAFCQVYRVTTESPLPTYPLSGNSGTTTAASASTAVSEYALKCLRPKARCSEKIFKVAAADLALEGDILARLDHENLIRLHGRSTGCVSGSFSDIDDSRKTNTSDKLGYFLVLDLLQPDTLKERLAYWRLTKKAPHHAHSSSSSSSRSLRSHSRSKSAMMPPPSSTMRGEEADMWTRIQTIATGIVHGMEYLHEQNVVLRDLKPENIGFCRTTGQVKLFDLGFARESHTVDPYEIAGSLRYLAPENAARKSSGLPADVYSFGVLLWELCTLKLPYGKFHTVQQFQDKVQGQQWRPSLKSIPSKRLRTLIQQCWAANPEQRPTFPEIRIELEGILQAHSTQGSSTPLSPSWLRGFFRSASWTNRSSSSVYLADQAFLAKQKKSKRASDRRGMMDDISMVGSETSPMSETSSVFDEEQDKEV